MRIYFLEIIIFTGFLLHGCGESLTDSRYVLQMPELPQAWEEFLGEPHWQIEWINSEGQTEKKTVPAGYGKTIKISIFQTCSNGITAFPYWPEKGIGFGIFKPAGAIFPFDIFCDSSTGKTLILSWQGGIDANLFREFAFLAGGLEERSVPRIPQNFNWPRFRELFNDPALNEEVRFDPWLADWKNIAEKTVLSGFDKRRLVPEARTNMKIPVSSGPWTGTSPFAGLIYFDEIPLFPVKTATDTWVSAEGILRCNNQTWIFIKNEK